jgi:glucokinase
VRREFGLYTLLIVNDFTALAMSLPGLQASDVMQIGGGTAVAKSVIGVLGGYWSGCFRADTDL